MSRGSYKIKALNRIILISIIIITIEVELDFSKDNFLSQKNFSAILKFFSFFELSKFWLVCFCIQNILFSVRELDIVIIMSAKDSLFLNLTFAWICICINCQYRRNQKKFSIRQLSHFKSLENFFHLIANFKYSKQQLITGLIAKSITKFNREKLVTPLLVSIRRLMSYQ